MLIILFINIIQKWESTTFYHYWSSTSQSIVSKMWMSFQKRHKLYYNIYFQKKKALL